MTRSVIVLGGSSSPIGSAIIDRLVSQCYGVCIVDIKNTPGSRRPGRLVCYRSYDPGIPGDLDFAVRDVIRNKHTRMEFIAVIDLGYCDEVGGFNPLTTLVPDTNGLEKSLLYIVIHTCGIGDKKLREMSSNYCHRTYLIKIPNMVLISPGRQNGCGNMAATLTLSRSPESRIVWVHDLSRLVCDNILRHPLRTTKHVIHFKVDGHEMSERLASQSTLVPPDLICVLSKNHNTFHHVYDNVELLYRFSLTGLCDSVRQSLAS